MSRPIISVEGLGKCYRVGHQSSKRESYTALRDVLAHNAKELFRKTRDLVSGRQIVQGDVVEDFWALKDVSFDVEPGEVVGIIGRNGAGKSTLLKILSRITEPSEGRVTLRGRVASLLEVGTGFHPELSGRENIFLNGAILGMTRTEIKRKFDEIVDFAEVEKFLDTPVKRYSSGMYVRLAFAVAAHLDPEILIVDEVLAVGDAEFQKKCLGKMGEVAKGGRTVLFVSHNLGAISTLCSSAILLQSGSVTFRGAVGEGIQNYSERNKPERVNTASIVLTEELTLSYLRIYPQKIKGAAKLHYKLTVEGSADVEITGLSMLFLNEEGIRIGIIDFRTFSKRLEVRPKSPLSLGGSVDLPELVEGNVSIGLYVETTDFGKNFFDLTHLTVEPGEVPKITPYSPSARGIISLTAQNIDVSG